MLLLHVTNLDRLANAVELLVFFFSYQESLGYVDISLADVVSNKRINERYHLIDSKNGRIQIELQWRTS